jgi:hypothetical protein
MSAAQFIGRVGGIAAALGVGVALLSGPAVAGADTDGSDTSSRVSASSSRSDSAAPTRRGMRAARAEASSAARAEASTPTRGRVTREVTESVPEAPPVSDFATSAPPEALATPAVSAVPAPAAATLTLPAPSATVAAPSATVPAPSAAAPVAPAAVPTFSPVPPSPTATTVTPYGVLGDWMINKEGKVADWVGQPYCGKGSTKENCTAETPGAKTMQEPINTVFQVKARSLYEAQLQLNWSLVVSGFGPSPFSSIGYSGIVGDKQFKQAPKGGPLGLGFLLPLPGELFQNGLTGSLLGVGPAYRDNLFLLTNSHLRTFGGQSDGKGNFIFTASVSEEAFDASTGLPSHSFESYDKARQKLVTNMTKASWISFASNQGLVEMNNAINPDNPTYTTGDHDGKAQVIAIGSLFGSSPVRTWF